MDLHPEVLQFRMVGRCSPLMGENDVRHTIRDHTPARDRLCPSKYLSQDLRWDTSDNHNARPPMSVSLL